MALETVTAKLVGVAPLMMHNGRLADPTNKWTIEMKKLTSVRKKTEEDLLQIRRVEWYGGLYTDDKGRVSVPSDCVLAAVMHGARKSKDGKEAQVGVFETQPWYPLTYEGPKDLEKLYEDGRFVDYRTVVVNKSRCMRSRPIFPEWSVDISLSVNTDIIDATKVIKALEMCGERVGFLEYRPRYGRFVVEA